MQLVYFVMDCTPVTHPYKSKMVKPKIKKAFIKTVFGDPYKGQCAHVVFYSPWSINFICEMVRCEMHGITFYTFF